MENTNKSMQKLKNEKLIELSTEDIKRIQACILDMMKELDEIFQKNNIEYYLGGGSALGSIRHKGFIPWDEDMDINMKRKDCERLIEIYKNTPEFSKKYYLCDNSYDKEFDVNFLRIKLKGTSFKEYLYEDYSKDGVFIDIFPVENMFNNKVLRNIHGFLVTTMLFITSCVRIHKKEEKYLNFKGNEKYSKNIKRKSALGKILSVIKLNTWLRISKKVMMMCKNEIEKGNRRLPQSHRQSHDRLHQKSSDRKLPFDHHSLGQQNPSSLHVGNDAVRKYAGNRRRNHSDENTERRAVCRKRSAAHPYQ